MGLRPAKGQSDAGWGALAVIPMIPGIIPTGHHHHCGSHLHLSRALDVPQKEGILVSPVWRGREPTRGVQAAVWWRAGLDASCSAGRVPGQRQEGGAALMAFVDVYNMSHPAKQP